MDCDKGDYCTGHDRQVVMYTAKSLAVASGARGFMNHSFLYCAGIPTRNATTCSGSLAILKCATMYFGVSRQRDHSLVLPKIKSPDTSQAEQSSNRAINAIAANAVCSQVFAMASPARRFALRNRQIFAPHNSKNVTSLSGWVASDPKSRVVTTPYFRIWPPYLDHITGFWVPPRRRR